MNNISRVGINKIYLLTNIANGKIYVGQTWLTLEDRMGRNGGGYSNSTYLYSAINKYGVDNFKYKMLAFCETQEDADKAEEHYMKLYNSRNNDIGYNLKTGGSAGRHSEISKERISKTLKEKAEKWTDEERAARSAPISSYWLGKERGPHTDEWKENNSKMMIERHKNNGHPMLGKTHTEDAKSKISESSKGRVRSPESVRKGADKQMMPKERELAIIEDYKSGMTSKSIQAKFKINSSGIYRVLERNNIPKKGENGKGVGRVHSEETRAKMSESGKKRWENDKDEK